ncbi:hypothetical protein FB451DRAFT_1166206 [Mycena latifolia]|nr:hypothetical protein FB451DRAFT_1166206 [Mycena latifolia]
MAHSHRSRRPRPPHLNIRMLSRAYAISDPPPTNTSPLLPSAFTRTEMMARGTSPEFLEQYLAGTLPHDILHSGVWLEIKLGHTKNLKRRLRQYEACQANDHQISFWGYCPVPRRMLAERLVHLRLGALGARLVPYPCLSCGVEHREFFPLAAAGGCNGVKSVVKTIVEELGGRFQCLLCRYIFRRGPAHVYMCLQNETSVKELLPGRSPYRTPVPPNLTQLSDLDRVWKYAFRVRMRSDSERTFPLLKASANTPRQYYSTTSSESNFGLGTRTDSAICISQDSEGSHVLLSNRA